MTPLAFFYGLQRIIYDWYSGKDSMHPQLQIIYYLRNSQCYNDVLRLQNLINLHLLTLKSTIAVTSNKILKELTPDIPFSEHILKFEFTAPEKLMEYIGLNKLKNKKFAPYIVDSLTIELEDHSKKNYQWILWH